MMWKWGSAFAAAVLLAGCGGYETGLVSAAGVTSAAYDATQACKLKTESGLALTKFGVDAPLVLQIQVRVAGGEFRPISQVEFDSADKDKDGVWDRTEFDEFFVNNKAITEIRYRKCS